MKPKNRIHLVGNVMIDNLLYQAKKFEKDNLTQRRGERREKIYLS